jgi:tight adherence protein C
VIALALLGAGIGAGAWLVMRSLAPRPLPLTTIESALSRPGVPANLQPPVRTARDRVAGVAARVLPALGDRADRSQLLRLTGRTAERLALDKLVGAVGGLTGTAVLGACLTLTGVAPPPAVLAVAALLVAAGGFLLPDLLLRDDADKRRRAFRHALSSYLDLVNVILAGGGGIETSLHAAAEAGDGWAFASIRRALDRARLTNRSPWDTFAELGDDLGIEELAELAASVELAGSQGARIRASLAAKADSLRGHQVAETEAAAEAATERMTIPVAVLLFGFLVFIAYPAVQQITTVSNPVP